MIACVAKYIKYFIHFCFLPLSLSLLVLSCSISGDYYESNENIFEYADLLFRRQNFLTQQVMMLLDDEMSSGDEDEISQAELQMHDACRLLNEYAIREIEGQTMSIFFRRKVKGSFKRCDESVKKMELIMTKERARNKLGTPLR